MKYGDLREHQQKAVAMLRYGWKQHRSHLINASCCFGITAVASYLCSQFQAAGVKTVRSLADIGVALKEKAGW